MLSHYPSPLRARRRRLLGIVSTMSIVGGLFIAATVLRIFFALITTQLLAIKGLLLVGGIAYLGGGPNDGYSRGNIFNALQYNGDARSLIEAAIGGSGAGAGSGFSATRRMADAPPPGCG